MTSKDKLIGVALILIGIGFIALGVVFGIKPAAIQNNNNNNQVYQEPNSNGTGDENEFIDEQDVNVYSETEENEGENQGELEEEGTNRYIY